MYTHCQKIVFHYRKLLLSQGYNIENYKNVVSCASIGLYMEAKDQYLVLHSSASKINLYVSLFQPDLFKVEKYLSNKNLFPMSETIQYGKIYRNRRNGKFYKYVAKNSGKHILTICSTSKVKKYTDKSFKILFTKNHELI